MSILVTGGAGYIGSHSVVKLLEAGLKVVVLDNLSNSNPDVFKRIERITGLGLQFIEGDILDKDKLEYVFASNDIEAVVHFAGLKAVGESVEMPLEYYYNNVAGTINLCLAMERHGVKRMVFSSSATVYGTGNPSPLTEDMPLATTNPYGSTKLMIEQIFRDIYASGSNWRIAILRYFNPIGAHESGMIGENPKGIPNNLMPYITQVAVGKREKLMVFGDDYDTPDGTGVRDYIHVEDLASGHVKALERLRNAEGIHTYNLGTGKGYSVLDVVRAFENATGIKIRHEIAERRIGDLAECFADPSKALMELSWKAEKTLEDMCRDSWRWQKGNPEGY
ncbi:MAG: UDP-glucose 4-epimerase GalE [Peptostreptococcaceae bacterium]|nr:UDP-glucose 4-epimerase GalE [Peptostreptococcaceae bacterium]